MKWRKLALIVVSAILLVALAGCGSSKSASGGKKSYNLKMSVTVSESSTWYKAAEKFAKEVEEKTDGRIKTKVYPNEQLSGGDSAKGVEMLVKGSTDFSYHSPIIYSVLDARLGVVSAPFLFKDLNEVDQKMNGKGGEELKKILSEKGIETLGFGENGFRQVTNSVHPIKTPTDLKGLKIRIPGIKMYTDLWRGYGADPTAMTFSEVFTALQQNTIDGQENPIDVIYSSKLNEVQKYISMWNYSYDPLIFGMNKKKFDSMSPDDQKIIKEAAKNANEYQIKLAREQEEKQIQELKDSGMEFYYPTDAEIEQFKKASENIYKTYEKDWGADLLKAFQES
ncbi:DctP family TRAP transporter solute-binding subunit [Heyndrickxia vini]|uniref:DctP family TRAP transporter solute-binding subunit n=1 Tax=Heyndrickxia vini TaxID=1476025 RepID=A0ABX7E3K8_9BACI|nr:DctP family TRAP transporter solute-binding subunit [Heyndrickxia vini]QQZ10146.1 DctP family TRAP transporter solute-binding subunit [Heyndrickxia vini]